MEQTREQRTAALRAENERLRAALAAADVKLEEADVERGALLWALWRGRVVGFLARQWHKAVMMCLFALRAVLLVLVRFARVFGGL